MNPKILDDIELYWPQSVKMTTFLTTKIGRSVNTIISFLNPGISGFYLFYLFLVSSIPFLFACIIVIYFG